MLTSTKYYYKVGRVIPYTKFLFCGKEYILTGQLSSGVYYHTYLQGTKNFAASQYVISSPINGRRRITENATYTQFIGLLMILASPCRCSKNHGKGSLLAYNDKSDKRLRSTTEPLPPTSQKAPSNLFIDLKEMNGSPQHIIIL